MQRRVIAFQICGSLSLCFPTYWVRVFQQSRRSGNTRRQYFASSPLQNVHVLCGISFPALRLEAHTPGEEVKVNVKLCACASSPPSDCKTVDYCPVSPDSCCMYLSTFSSCFWRDMVCYQLLQHRQNGNSKQYASNIQDVTSLLKTSKSFPITYIYFFFNF